MTNTNGEKVAAIRQAWHELMPEDPPIVYGDGVAVDLNLYAQIAINVLTDWHKREQEPYRQQLADIRERCVGYTPDPSVVEEIVTIIDGTTE